MSRPKSLKYFRCEDHQTELRITNQYVQVMYNKEQIAVFLKKDVEKFLGVDQVIRNTVDAIREGQKRIEAPALLRTDCVYYVNK